MTTEQTNLAPGRGVIIALTEEVLSFFHEAFEDMWNAAGGQGELDALLDEQDPQRTMEFLKAVSGSAAGWRKAKDDYGIKLYKEMPYRDGAYRVTLVINARTDELQIDIRQWYDPSKSGQQGKSRGMKW